MQRYDVSQKLVCNCNGVRNVIARDSLAYLDDLSVLALPTGHKVRCGQSSRDILVQVKCTVSGHVSNIQAVRNFTGDLADAIAKLWWAIFGGFPEPLQKLSGGQFEFDILALSLCRGQIRTVSGTHRLPNGQFNVGGCLQIRAKIQQKICGQHSFDYGSHF